MFVASFPPLCLKRVLTQFININSHFSFVRQILFKLVGTTKNTKNNQICGRLFVTKNYAFSGQIQNICFSFQTQQLIWIVFQLVKKKMVILKKTFWPQKFLYWSLPYKFWKKVIKKISKNIASKLCYLKLHLLI